MPFLIRKIGAAKEWPLIITVQKHGQRPAAATLGNQLVRSLINLIDIRALLAIDLDIDKQPIHYGRNGVVFKRFMRHDVAPVAGGIAH